jgi:hypothetical protein
LAAELAEERRPEAVEEGLRERRCLAPELHPAGARRLAPPLETRPCGVWIATRRVV